MLFRSLTDRPSYPSLASNPYISVVEVVKADLDDHGRSAWEAARLVPPLTSELIAGVVRLDQTKGSMPGSPQPLVERDDHHSFTCSPDGELLASSSSTSPLTLWRVNDRVRPIVSFTNPSKSPAINVFSGDGELVVTGAADGTLHVHKVRDLLDSGDRIFELGHTHRSL